MSARTVRWCSALALVVLVVAPQADGQSRATPPLAFAPPDGSSEPLSSAAPSKKDQATDARPALLATTVTVASIHLREVIPWDGACAPRSTGPRRIDWLLRDRTNWQSATMDDQTLSAVLSTCERFSAQRIEVISGYRSSKMNEMLRKKGRHVAQRSQHPMATAVDFRLVEVEMEPVFRTLERGHNGGVGRYRDDAFVHVDSGPRRRWRGE
jgi:uncharacterized protein YcbK (DUF882 family)